MIEFLRAQLRRGILGESWPVGVATLLLLAAWYGVNLLYDPLNHGPNRIFLRTPVDQGIPLVPVFAIPYVSLTPYIAVTMVLLLVARVRLFRSAAVAMIIAWLVSYAFYFFLQSYVARPALTGSDPLTAMIRTVYQTDQPYNDFPSLHTSLSTIVAIHWWRVDRRIGTAAACWTLLIVASTVFVHQHYLADLAAGLLLAAGASACGLRFLAGRGSPIPAAAAVRPAAPAAGTGGR
ncbi:MAG TPA: phosphatase PAP2 family protein [Candidatus Binatia bacterium]|nr:phosphatase PAP2 family protein [Candidatus Binatia bacterium]